MNSNKWLSSGGQEASGQVLTAELVLPGPLTPADLPAPCGVVGSVVVNGGQVVQARRGLTCSHCGALGINGISKLLLHIDRMHSKPYTCTICKVEFIDRYYFNMHSPTCFHFCPVDGCNYQEKRESRMKGHVRRHRSV